MWEALKSNYSWVSPTSTATPEEVTMAYKFDAAITILQAHSVPQQQEDSKSFIEDILDWEVQCS